MEKDLKRYKIDGGMGHDSGLTSEEICDYGEWVKYEDVKPLLEAAIEMLTYYGNDFSKTQNAEIKLKRAIKKATGNEE